ncbi:MAG: DNA translocase FtsK 4TM domain-containing protein, partial [Acidobacteria bacterium]|nr:DNA translocase FtsK 4TM domain-containing protein [Acidobacteriota bacterium]
MSGTTISHRVSEFSGVALFALALVWLIALTTYDPADAVWFFNTGGQAPPHNFVGQVGALLAELSYQVVGFAAYLFPVIAIVVGWHYFWCRQLPAAGTKTVGLGLMLGSGAALLSLALGDGGGAFRAGGLIGDGVARVLAEYLNRTGSIIVILTGVFLSVILATQFSFGRMGRELSRGTARDRPRSARGRSPAETPYRLKAAG